MPDAARPHEPPSADPGGRGATRTGDVVLCTLARGSALVTVLLLAMLVVVVVASAMPAIREYGLGFLTDETWQPNEREVQRRDAQGRILTDDDGEPVMVTLKPSFGAAAFIWGTVMSSAIALVVAVPMSLGAALFIVRVAPRWRIAAPLGFLIEFLAAIPSIAFGIWGIFVLRPVLQDHVEPWLRWLLGDIPFLHFMFYRPLPGGGEAPIPATGRDLLAGGLILAIMILPIITAVARDVLRTVPRAQIEGSLALGATWWQSSAAMLRYARAGLLGAIMLGLARAAGETMAITMVIGNVNQVSISPLAPAQTMSSLLASEVGDPENPLHFPSLMYIALILLVLSLVFNVLARWLVVGSRGSPSAH